MKFRIGGIVACVLALLPSVGLAGEATSQPVSPTRDTYRKALATHVTKVHPTARWARMVAGVLKADNPPADGKYIVIGREEISRVLPLTITSVWLADQGDAQSAETFKEAALQTVRVCSKVAVDHYYAEDEDGEGGSRGQISFVLADVVHACQILRDRDALVGEDRVRVRQMLEVIADHRMKIMPDPSACGLSNWINRAGLGVLRVANYLQRESETDAEFARSRPDLPTKITAMRRYSVLPLKCGMDYPYLYRLLPDGKYSEPFTYDGRGEARTERAAPADRKPQFGVTENSDGYAADSVIHLLRLIAEAPAELIPEFTPERKKQLCEWMKGWQALVMPIGTVPSYGDSFWSASTGWLNAFELAAALCKDVDPVAASQFRATAARIFRYGQTVGQGYFDSDLCMAALATDDSIRPGDAPATSTIVLQQNPRGSLQPSKIVLRGEPDSADAQPFVMFDTFLNTSHSHGAIGGLSAYAAGGSVFQHELGYDAGEQFFHNLVLMRPANEPFLPFASVFTDPQETVIEKGNKGLRSDPRTFVSAELNVAKVFDHARIVTRFTPLLSTAKYSFQLTRDAVLEKRSGVLIVCDTVSSETDVPEPVACSPLWHVQSILDKSQAGFLCQDDHQIIVAPKVQNSLVMASPVRPVWIGMAGPTGRIPESVEWHFMSKRQRFDLPQRQHLYLAGADKFLKGQSRSYVTVFVPMPAGTREVATPPAATSMKDGMASITLGTLTYQLGAIAGRPNTILRVFGRDSEGRPYEATVPKQKNPGQVR